MSKKKIGFGVSTSLILTLFSGVVLTSCGTTTSTSTQIETTSSTSEKENFKVTYTASDEYSVTGLKEGYEEGETVSFSVVIVEGSEYLVSSITTNISGLTPVLNEGVYSFSMPNQDVSLTINLGEAYPDIYEGSGDESDPIIIENHNQLARFRDDYNSGAYDDVYCYVELNNDIDLKGNDWEPIGSLSHQFIGVFNGNSHTIDNLKPVIAKEENENISFNSVGFAGLFGVTNEAFITDLNLTNVNLDMSISGKTSLYYIGTVAGYSYNSAFSEINVSIASADINSLQNESSRLEVGGLVAEMDASGGYAFNVTGLTVQGDINVDMSDASDDSYNVTGGIIGMADFGSYENILSITNSSFQGSIQGKDYVGGILGYSSTYVSVVNCFTTGESLKATSTDGAYVGGILGFAYYDTAVIESFSIYDEISAPNSTSTYFKSYAGIINGYSYETEYYILEYLGASVINSYGKVTTLKGDNVDNSQASDLSLKAMAEACNFNQAVWYLDGEIPTIKDNADYETKVNVTFKANDGTTADVVLQATPNSFVSEVAQKSQTDDFEKDGYSFYGYAYEENGENLFIWYAPLTHDVTLYGQFADLSPLLGSYSVTATYYDDSWNAGTYTFTKDQFIWLMTDGCVSYYDYKFDGEHIYIQDYVGEEAYEGNLGQYADTVSLFDATTSTISGYDMTSDDCEYSATKITTTVLPPDYTNDGIVGDWINSSGNTLHFSKDGNYYGSYTSSYTQNVIQSVGGYSLSGNNVAIGYASGLMAKTSAKYDATQDVIYNETGVVLSRKAIDKVYKTSDGLVSISISGDKKYVIADASLTTFEGTLADGETIKINGKQYTVSGEVLTLVEEKEYAFAKTWTGKVGINDTTLIINNDGTGTYNGTEFTWTESNNTITGTASAFTLTMIYDETKNTLAVTFEDDDYNEFTGTLTAEQSGEDPDTPVVDEKGYVGTWTGTIGYNSITLVINSDGTGTYGDTTFTWTESNNTITGTCDDFTLTMVYDSSADTLKVTWTDEYEGYSFEGTMTKQSTSATKTCVGTWSGTVGANKVTVVINSDGTGTYGEASFTWTESDGTITGTGADFTLTMVYDSSADTLKVNWTDEYEEYSFDGTLTRA